MGIQNIVRRQSRTLSETLNNFLTPYAESMIVRETSWLGVLPGDLVHFDYPGSSRSGLVVSSRRTARGYFLSPRGNTLLNIVEIEALTDSMFSLMINNLYKNRAACNYYSPRIIGSFMGKENFKTFNVAEITNFLSVSIAEHEG